MADDEPKLQQGGSAGKRSKRPKVNTRNSLIALVVLVLVVIAGLLAYKYNEAQKDVERLSNPQESARQEAREISQRVSKYVEVPTNETPTVATVTDVSKLKNQAFFAKAQNGDKVLIFTEARRAILYRPSTDKVIEIAPINIGDGNTQNQTESTEDTQQ